jgi:hypothetical protein
VLVPFLGTLPRVRFTPRSIRVVAGVQIVRRNAECLDVSFKFECEAFDSTTSAVVLGY